MTKLLFRMLRPSLILPNRRSCCVAAERAKATKAEERAEKGGAEAITIEAITIEE